MPNCVEGNQLLVLVFFTCSKTHFYRKGILVGKEQPLVSWWNDKIGGCIQVKLVEARSAARVFAGDFFLRELLLEATRRGTGTVRMYHTCHTTGVLPKDLSC
eukprot:gnl/TRDRNA2_/TRDRNA2_147688_c1_seq1.p1 gnl/TRDRNA2_/TRDRNA2_147688_c1~~gnl/TRDRNA2_/TRDRNA2_147688_c1_seq1.p1  ORF type:complete len:102 (-),score=9.50 gnl/TRDRNA2_/TRDRNA2_147688_c1_seq1:164-469(-)